MAKFHPIADIDNLTAADLRDDAKLQRCYLEFVRRGFWSNSPQNVLEFFSLAVKALADDKHGTPGKLFYALIKAKDVSKVTDAMEDRARNRLNSGERQELAEKGAELSVVKRSNRPKISKAEISDQLFGRNIGYHHGVMMQCFLPQAPYSEACWQSDHGRASLMIEAGRIPDPTTPNRFEQRSVPHGTKARLIMPYIVGYAVQHKTAEIDMGKSLRTFLRGIKMPITGPNGKEVTRQVENIAASTITLGVWGDQRVKSETTRVAKEISFWLERTEDQTAMWKPSMVLSTDFYEALQNHRVPIDMDHLVRLGRSARRQDLYVWLSYRLPKLSRPLNMPLSTLHEIFGQGIASPWDFKRRLKEDLAAIAKVYDGFKIELKGDYLRLTHSLSPVPQKITRLIPK